MPPLTSTHPSPRASGPFRRGVENSCLPVGDAQSDGVLTYGRGLLQV